MPMIGGRAQRLLHSIYEVRRQINGDLLEMMVKQQVPESDRTKVMVTLASQAVTTAAGSVVQTLRQDINDPLVYLAACETVIDLIREEIQADVSRSLRESGEMQ